MSEHRPVAPAEDLGSPELAAALAARDPEAVATALRTGWVVVPTIAGDDGARRPRLFDGLDPDRPGWELALFSSVATLRDFLADDPQREFDFVHGASLADTLDPRHGATIARVIFDPAGPFPSAADAADVHALLASATPPLEPPQSSGIRETDRALDLVLPLGDDWARLDLTVPAAETEQQIAALVERQLAGLPAGPTLRTQLAQWLRRMARAAEAAGGRETAFLLRRTTDAALALSVTRFWNRLGAPVGGRPHLDAVAARLSDAPGSIVTAELATGRLLRHTRVQEPDARAPGVAFPVLTIDYWLEFPDGRGLCLVSFSSPHTDLEETLSALTDEIVVAATWVLAQQEGA